MKYEDLTSIQIEAIIKKLGGNKGALRFLQNESYFPEQSRRWQNNTGGGICFSVTSDGTSGSEWFVRFESKSLRIGYSVKSILCSPDFIPTKGITTKVMVMNGVAFNDSERITENIRVEANKEDLQKPSAEIACLIREAFTDKDIENMGVRWLVVMHEPIKDSGGMPGLLRLGCRYNDESIGVYYGKPKLRWHRANGFVFVHH